MQKDELMLKVENVSKVYRLGEIGGTTLRDELQRLKAKVFHKEDPTKKIGAKNYNKGEKFKALDNISFEVKKGERIGIIGHNGAGKSTLLKLISRVTGPTDGKIYLNGRVASMLEVGTGFHPELTGRENVYMNGAILGMTKKEIDAKMEDIIEFSEVRQFIDTPVKRYSSGMYVKLAFSVAAHLNSEIVIMDEVLAVGDVSFQSKCISKLRSIGEEEEKTILYVSHNMSTIRQLCSRVIVLDHGKLVFDGGVEEGIGYYLGISKTDFGVSFKERMHWDGKKDYFELIGMELIGKDTPLFNSGEVVHGKILLDSKKDIPNFKIRFEISNTIGQKIGTAFSNASPVYAKENTIYFQFETKELTPGSYFFDIVAFTTNNFGGEYPLDGVYPGFVINISDNLTNELDIQWKAEYWGSVHFSPIKISKE